MPRTCQEIMHASDWVGSRLCNIICLLLNRFKPRNQPWRDTRNRKQGTRSQGTKEAKRENSIPQMVTYQPLKL